MLTITSTVIRIICVLVIIRVTVIIIVVVMLLWYFHIGVRSVAQQGLTCGFFRLG